MDPHFDELDKILLPNYYTDQFLPVNNVVLITRKFIMRLISGAICVVIRAKCVEVSVQLGSPDFPLELLWGKTECDSPKS